MLDVLRVACGLCWCLSVLCFVFSLEHCSVAMHVCPCDIAPTPFSACLWLSHLIHSPLYFLSIPLSIFVLNLTESFFFVRETTKSQRAHVCKRVEEQEKYIESTLYIYLYLHACACVCAYWEESKWWIQHGPPWDLSHLSWMSRWHHTCTHTRTHLHTCTHTRTLMHTRTQFCPFLKVLSACDLQCQRNIHTGSGAKMGCAVYAVYRGATQGGGAIVSTYYLNNFLLKLYK